MIPETPAPKTTEPSAFVIAVHGLVQVLSLRGILLLSLIGAFVIAFKAMANESILTLIVLAIYCVCTVFPVAYLEVRRQA